MSAEILVDVLYVALAVGVIAALGVIISIFLATQKLPIVTPTENFEGAKEELAAEVEAIRQEFAKVLQEVEEATKRAKKITDKEV